MEWSGFPSTAEGPRAKVAPSEVIQMWPRSRLWLDEEDDLEWLGRRRGAIDDGFGPGVRSRGIHGRLLHRTRYMLQETR